MRALLLVVALSAGVAVAEEGSDRPGEVLRTQLATYYRGERLAGFVPFTVSGVAGLAAGSLLVGSNTDLGRAAGWVNIGFGALELVAGLVVGFSSFGRERSLAELLAKDEGEFLRAERARVERITKGFQPILLGVWGATALAGGVLAGVGGATRDDVMLGLGLGLAVQGLLFFLLDFAVLDRANAYGTALGL
jgi:hypothetical protein